MVVLPEPVRPMMPSSWPGLQPSRDVLEHQLLVVGEDDAVELDRAAGRPGGPPRRRR